MTDELRPGVGSQLASSTSMPPGVAREGTADGRPGRRLLAIVVVLVILVIAGGTLLAFERYDSERRAIVSESLTDATSVAARVELFFGSRIETLETIALTPLVRTGQPAAIKAWFEELVDAGSTFTGGLSLIGTDGIMVLLSGFPLEEAPVDLSDRAYVRDVLATGRPAIGDAIIGRLSGDPLVTIAVPVNGPDGRMQGVLAGTIRIDLEAGGFGMLGTSIAQAAIIDGSGQVVIDRGVVSTPLPADRDFLAAIAEGTGFREGLIGPHGEGSWLAGWAPIGQTRWRAVVLQTSEEGLAPAWRTFVLTLAAIALLGLVAILATLPIARRLDAAAERQRRAADELREREAFLHRFADALPVMAGTLDQQGQTTFANATLRELGGEGLLDVLHPDDLRKVPPRSNPATSGTTEVRIRDDASPDGYRWHRIGFVEAQDAGSGWFFAATDIDKETREELGLRQDIQQRDEFLGLVSHELRTPLTVIRGNALLLSRRGDHANPEALAEGLQDIEASSRQLQRLLENMLVLSRLSTFDPGTEIEPQIVAALVSGAVSEFQERHPGVRVELEIEDGLPIVAANATFVDQVMWNLLTNAQRYGGPGPISVRVRSRSRWVEVAVSDRGPGIPPDDLRHVFEPHFRSKSSSDRASGLGLGLTVCRRLVEWQGGTMSAEPNLGGGMRFAFTLRTLDEDEPALEGEAIGANTSDA